MELNIMRAHEKILFGDLGNQADRCQSKESHTSYRVPLTPTLSGLYPLCG